VAASAPLTYDAGSHTVACSICVTSTSIDDGSLAADFSGLIVTSDTSIGGNLDISGNLSAGTGASGTAGCVHFWGADAITDNTLCGVSGGGIAPGAITVSAIGTTCSSGLLGAINVVTDATSPAIGSTVAGGGSANALVWCNGVNWTVVGK
jgi:LSD1 subclass zinc finger protein